MEDKEFNRLKQEVVDAMKKIHLGGLKGEVLHEHIRSIATNLHFRWIEKNEMKIEDLITKLDEDIKNHLVTKAENDEEHAVLLIIKDYIMLYLTVHSIMLYEKRDLAEIGEMAKEFKRLCRKKGIPDDVAKQVGDIMKKGADEWKAELEDLRKMINSVWAKANERSGWALSAFSKMHKEGFFIRYQERKRFKDALRNASDVNASEKKIRKVQSKEELIKIFTGWFEKEKNIANDYRLIAKMLFNTWAHITGQLSRILSITVDAQKIHELPKSDADQMVELHNIIIENLDKKYLHALRIDDKQLEAIYSDVSHEIEGIRKAA